MYICMTLLVLRVIHVLQIHDNTEMRERKKERKKERKTPEANEK